MGFSMTPVALDTRLKISFLLDLVNSVVIFSFHRFAQSNLKNLL